MVEGPSCKRKAERLQVLSGRRLLRAGTIKCLQRCQGEAIRRVVAVGKELLIVFETAVLRLHFGMAGGADFHPIGIVIKQRKRTSPDPDMSCEFTGGVFHLHGATTKLLEFSDLASIEERKTRDILNPAFDRAEVLAILRGSADRLVCDVVMDQAVLPGVGNVIKVEALFSAGVHPLAPARTIGDAQWAALIEGLRSCAQRWYAALRGRGKLVKECYGRSACAKCGGKVMLIREGALRRVTYFCIKCQPPPSESAKVMPHSPIERANLAPAVQSNSACIGGHDYKPSSSKPAHQVVTPRCTCGVPAALKQTFKEGPNRERHFFCCARSRCRTFQWLDTQLPRCNHGPARLRRVLRMGPNNGRHFAACPAPKGQSCGLFLWISLESPQDQESPGTLQARLADPQGRRNSAGNPMILQCPRPLTANSTPDKANVCAALLCPAGAPTQLQRSGAQGALTTAAAVPAAAAAAALAPRQGQEKRQMQGQRSGQGRGQGQGQEQEQEHRNQQGQGSGQGQGQWQGKSPLQRSAPQPQQWPGLVLGFEPRRQLSPHSEMRSGNIPWLAPSLEVSHAAALPPTLAQAPASPPTHARTSAPAQSHGLALGRKAAAVQISVPVAHAPRKRKQSALNESATKADVKLDDDPQSIGPKPNKLSKKQNLVSVNADSQATRRNSVKHDVRNLLKQAGQRSRTDSDTSKVFSVTCMDMTSANSTMTLEHNLTDQAIASGSMNTASNQAQFLHAFAAESFTVDLTGDD